MDIDWSDFSEDYGPAIRSCLIWQVAIGVLAGLMLDQGQTARAYGVALLCHWAINLIILHRRPRNPSRLDLAIIRYSILPLLVLIGRCGPWFLQLIGTPPEMIP
jgi:hypothetical protein